MRKNIRDIVINNDNRLFDIATYMETKGNMLIPSVEITQKIYSRFGEFKQRVLKGSVTIDRIEQDVFSKFGILEGSQYVNSPVSDLPIDIKEEIDRLEREYKENEVRNK